MTSKSPIVAVLILLTLASLVNANPAPGPVQDLAGTGARGVSGAGGSATEARRNDPCGLVAGPDEALYVCDTANHAIRPIAPDQTMTAVVGTGKPGYTGDGGAATKATLNDPYEV